MAYENELRLIGNLGADPEVVPLQDGIVVKLRLGQTKKWRDKTTGEPQERKDWFYIDVYGQSAKFASEYFVKGMTILVKAGLRNRKWEDSNGEPRYTNDIVVSERGHEVQILCYPKNFQAKVQGDTPKAEAKNHLEPQPNKPQQPQQQSDYREPPRSQSGVDYAPPPQHGNQTNWNEDRPFGN